MNGRVLVGIFGVTLATVSRRAERAVGVLAFGGSEDELARVPVDFDLAVTADLLARNAPVATAALGEGLGAATAAEQVVFDDHRAVRDVPVGGRVGGLDVDVGTGDGLRQGGNGAELEEPGLHFEWVLFLFLKRY